MLYKHTLLLALICLAKGAFATVIPPTTDPKTSGMNSNNPPGRSYFKDQVARWYDKIIINGQVNVAGFASNKTPTTVGMIPPEIGPSPAASDIEIPFANLTAKSQVTDWTLVSMALAFSQRSPSFIRSPVGGGEVFFLDSAFILFENPDYSPFYVKVGRFFLDFGGLDVSSITESTVQLLSLTRATQLLVGLHNWQGFNASLYVFRPPFVNYYTETNTTHANAIGIDFSYGQKTSNYEFILDAGYLSNMMGGLYPSSTVARGSRFIFGQYSKTVPALDLNAFFKIRQFDFSVNYIAALSAFSVFDVPYTNDWGQTFIGAKPSAYGVNIGYSFPAFWHETRLGGGYQGSTQSVALGRAAGSLPEITAGIYGNFFAIGLPRERFYINYVIKKVQGVDIGFEIDSEKGYGYVNGGTGKRDVVGIIIVSAKMNA